MRKLFIGSRKRKAATAILLLFVTAAVAIGIAAWTGALFQATGNAKAATFTNPTVTNDATAASAASGSDLAYPSSSATGSLFFKVTNPNPYPVYLDKIQGGSMTGTGTPAGCTASFWDIPAAVMTPTALVGVGVVAGAIPAGASNLSVKMPSAIRLLTTAPDICQGATLAWDPTAIGFQFGTS